MRTEYRGIPYSSRRELEELGPRAQESGRTTTSRARDGAPKIFSGWAETGVLFPRRYAAALDVARAARARGPRGGAPRTLQAIRRARGRDGRAAATAASSARPNGARPPLDLVVAWRRGDRTGWVRATEAPRAASRGVALALDFARVHFENLDAAGRATVPVVAIVANATRGPLAAEVAFLDSGDGDVYWCGQTRKRFPALDPEGAPRVPPAPRRAEEIDAP